MSDIETALADWKASLCREVPVGGLFARNEVVHKWKSPWRSLLLREAVAWRLQDLLEQSYLLYKNSHLLGARILLRSGFETVAVLIYLNQEMRRVVAGALNFHEFSERTAKLLLGSRDNTTEHQAINIVTVLQKADKRYPGLEDWYAALCESAHPNYEGMLVGYSKADSSEYLTTFQNRWVTLYEKGHSASIGACMSVFEAEYNHEWSSAFEELEQWILKKDVLLKSTKPREG